MKRPAAPAYRRFSGPRNAPKPVGTIRDGSDFWLLGRRLTVRLLSPPMGAGRAEVAGDALVVRLPARAAGKGEDAATEFCRAWLAKCAKEYFAERLEAVYALVEKHGVPKPELRVKAERGRWGSCAIWSRRVNLNVYLMKAPPECVDYVILHELAHLLHRKHDAAFHAFLSRCMPDWRVREKTLDAGTMPGL